MRNVRTAILGASWRTTAIGYLLGAVQASPYLPSILSGHAVAADWRGFVAGVLLAVLGRLAVDAQAMSQTVTLGVVRVTPKAVPVDQLSALKARLQSAGPLPVAPVATPGDTAQEKKP